MKNDSEISLTVKRSEYEAENFNTDPKHNWMQVKINEWLRCWLSKDWNHSNSLHMQDLWLSLHIQLILNTPTFQLDSNLGFEQAIL